MVDAVGPPFAIDRTLRKRNDETNPTTARRCAVPYGDDMFTTIVVWVVGLTVGYVGLRAIRTRSWSRPDRSED